MSCDETIINVDWQFNVNAHEGASSFTDTPLRALASFGYYRELNINTHRVELLRPDADTLAINALLRGQSHNSAAQQTYINCAAQLGIYAFFRLIVSAAPGRPSDFAELRINISWKHEMLPVK